MSQVREPPSTNNKAESIHAILKNESLHFETRATMRKVGYIGSLPTLCEDFSSHAVVYYSAFFSWNAGSSFPWYFHACTVKLFSTKHE